MKRMIPQALIAWVKSLFARIHPGDKEGDIEIGGDVEVDGYFYPSVKIAGYAGASGGITLDGTNASLSVLKISGIYDRSVSRSAYILAGNKYSKIWASPNAGGHFCNAQLLSYSLNDSNNMWSGVGIIHNDSSAETRSALDIGFAHQYTGYRTYNNYLILNDRLEVKKCDTYLYNTGVPTSLKTTIELTTSPEGTGSLVSERIEKNETYIAGHNTLHFNLTEGAGTATSGQVTFTGTGLDTTMKATGVLLKANVLVGVCYLMVNSATEAVLYYQNPLGLDLAAGDYTANLQLEASN